MNCFVQLSPNKDGMIHISKLSNERVEKSRRCREYRRQNSCQSIRDRQDGKINLKLEEKIED